MMNYFAWQNTIQVEVHIVASENFGVEKDDAHQQNEQMRTSDWRYCLDQVIYHCNYYI